jgi:hypothetical protein
MANYINHDNVKVISKDGEVTIHLNININLNGEIQNSQNLVYSKKIEDKTILNQEDEKTMWEIPDFTPIKNKVNFGK